MTDVRVQAVEEGEPRHSKGRALFPMVLGSVGIVYGDIGTSPLYAMRESLAAAGSDGLTRAEVIGITSLLIWALVVLVTLKYVILMMRADNRGEGGTLSLVALVQQALGTRPGWLLALGILGVSLFMGDAIITPAVSVLSAVEGMELIAPRFASYVVPVTLVILVALFAVQRNGTGTVSVLFGPVMVVWFATIAAMGLFHVGDEWSILLALNPGHAVGFLASHGFGSLVVMGSVFLAVTGGEALYADMGHFGRRPIGIAWHAVVFPALALNYLGQGALVLKMPAAASDPFFLMAPEGFLLPFVLLATAATVIASQAVISGAFSMFKQASRMGLMPRLEILHTSSMHEGQIYLPKVNRYLFVGVVLLVLAFRSSSGLAAAYGIAVTGVMIITSVLALILFVKAWKWPVWQVAAIMVPFLGLEVLFLAANSTKFMAGGFVPVAMAAVSCFLMWTWVRGTQYVLESSRRAAVGMPELAAMLRKSSRLKIVTGTAVFLTSDPHFAPAALLHNVKHNQVLHEQNIVVTVLLDTRPAVPDAERVVIERIDDRFVRVRMSFGYIEDPNVPRALADLRKRGIRFEIMATSFFLNRRSFKSSKEEGLPGWQEDVFIALAHSAADAAGFYHLPTDRVIEIGQQILI